LCWGENRSVEDLARSDEIRTNPLFTEVPQPGVGDMVAARNPLRFASMPASTAAPAPALGEHTAEVLSQLLGIGDAEYGRLRAAMIA
jgi:2-methylfumaryl-CoA isomerase